MKKVNVLWLIASICWFFWTLINVFELLTDVPFIISVCGTIFIFAAVENELCFIHEYRLSSQELTERYNNHEKS